MLFSCVFVNVFNCAKYSHHERCNVTRLFFVQLPDLDMLFSRSSFVRSLGDGLQRNIISRLPKKHRKKTEMATGRCGG